MKDEEYEIERLRREKESRKRSFEGSIFSLESFVEYCRKYEEGHFFDPGTFRFWKMRLCYGKDIKKTPNGLYFMHSDKKCFDDNRREYKIRWWSADTGRFALVRESMRRNIIDRAWDELPTDVDFDLDNEWWKTEEGKKYRETCLPNV